MFVAALLDARVVDCSSRGRGGRLPWRVAVGERAASCQSAERGEAISRAGPERYLGVKNRDVCRFTPRLHGTAFPEAYRRAALGRLLRSREGTHVVASSGSNPFDSLAGTHFTSKHGTGIWALRRSYLLLLTSPHRAPGSSRPRTRV